MTLFEACDYIVSLEIVDSDHVYAGKLDDKKEQSIGCYNLKNNSKPHIPIGGMENASYDVKSVSILIHWNRNQNQTEQVAQKLYDALMTTENTVVKNKERECKILFCKMLVPHPQDVGTDEKGIYESVIEVEIYTERN